MKKIGSLIIVAIFISSLVNAQDLISKNGHTILPEQGDIALGFNAIPLLDFALNTFNIMNNTGQTAQHPGFVDGFSQVIVGKYFLNESTAVRARVGINTSRLSTSLFFDDPIDVDEHPADPDKWEEIEDVDRGISSSSVFGIGLEKRRGHNRLQGFYGGELLLGFSKSSLSNTWAVEMTEEAIDKGFTNGNGSAIDGRMLSATSGRGVTLGVRAFVGVEYFFAPKMSIAGEFGWGVGYITNPRGKAITEVWDATAKEALEEESLTSSKSSFFGFTVDDGFAQTLLPAAALTLSFHF